MQNDTNTKGYNQWFYFSFQNRSLKKVRFNIVNFIKKKLMFLDGVKPVGFSAKENIRLEEFDKNHESRYRDWYTIGSNVIYKKSYVTREIKGGKDK